MTAAEIRNEVTKKYHEGQELSLRVKGERGSYSIKAKIIKFNPNSILTEHNGYKESFAYWEFLQMTGPPGKPKKIIVPVQVRARGAYRAK